MEEVENKRSEGSVEKGAENTGKVEKKRRKRQKKTLADLQKQIEFYFSAPNLQKDRFLRQKITESDNGCVEIETIASFNRMKQLSTDNALILKAVKLCPSVEVIDDKWVKPSQPIPEQKNVDSVTVYVERLPPHADHDWIKSCFSSCGNVVYVSLPRYKTTRDIKGFAFVEFEKESEAQAAVEMFAVRPQEDDEPCDKTESKTENGNELETAKQNKKNKKRKGKLSESENEDTRTKSKKAKRKREDAISASSNPSNSETESNANINKDELKSKKRNMDEELFEESETKRVKHEVKRNGENVEQSGSEDTLEESKSKKRKRKRSGECDDEGTLSKKNKEAQESDSEVCSAIEKSETTGKTGPHDAVVGNAEVNDENVDEKKKRRKRKKKENQESKVPQLRVISKTEWQRLKQEYHKLQREAMKDAKAKLKIEFDSKKPQVSKAEQKSEEAMECKTDTGIPGNGEKSDSKRTKELPAKLEMQPGVVLRFSTEERIDKRKLREVFSAMAPVAYLEKEDDSNTGHVRFATKEACEKVVDMFSNSGTIDCVKIEKLTEKEDAEYWERLNDDRVSRFKGKNHNRNRRGRQKVTKKLDERSARKHGHIHFED